jgi:DNA-binding XRE family transcriptional regulator
MNDSEDVRAFRRELGRALKLARCVAGYSQAQLALQTGYARSTVSTVEGGGQNVPRVFWERSDDVLGTGTALTAGHDRIERWRAAECPEPAVRAGTACAVPAGETGRAGPGLNAGTVAEAVAACQRLGWRAEAAGGRAELLCGTGAEALEVPRAAGVVAVRWWLHTGGLPDEIRGLAGLPCPQDALAVVAAGDRWFFLVQAGACPWAGPDLAGAPPASSALGVVLRWHAGGSRIPVPPSRDGTGQRVAWAYPPPGRVRLADPVVLLDLLARAAALTGDRNHVLTLPGGVCVVPTAGYGQQGTGTGTGE